MKIHKGTNRMTLILPRWGVVVKFPLIHLGKASTLIFKQVRAGRWDAIRFEWSRPVDALIESKKLLFLGIVANRNEFAFYQETKNPFLQPTYFSFFGFLNIQKMGEPCTVPEVEWWRILQKITNEDVYDDPPHFSDPQNFCFSGGAIKMVDYGSSRCHEVVKNHGLKIMGFFRDWRP